MLKHRRASRNLTISEVADASGVGRHTVWEYERGKNLKGIAGFVRLVSVLGGEIRFKRRKGHRP